MATVVLVLVGCHRGLGAGPLQPPASDAINANFSGFQERVNQLITFGFVFPVRNYGEEPAILDRVELVEATEGIALDGSLAVDITSQNHTWSGDDQFPPGHPRDQQPLAGFEIAPNASQTVQILIGIRLTQPGQVGFEQVAILYHVGDRQYRYLFPAGAALCSKSFYIQHPGADSCEGKYLFGERSPTGSA